MGGSWEADSNPYDVCDVAHESPVEQPHSSRHTHDDLHEFRLVMTTAHKTHYQDQSNFWVEEARPPTCPACGADMEWSDFSDEAYSIGWRCNNFDVCGSR